VLYPQLDDGNPDLEFRATHLRWFAGRCDYLLRRIPLTKKGLGWFSYYDSRDMTRERAALIGDAPEDYKRAERDKAVAVREAATLEFGDALKATPKSFYVTAFGHMEAAQEALVALEALCDERYGKDFAPNFSQLRNVLEEIKDAVGTLLDKKRETEPDQSPQVAAPAQIEEEVQVESASPTASRTLSQ